MIEAATSDEDKVTPVYKLEEICELLRSSHVSIVKEVSEFILKRLQHKSPVVKQKALRVIKYAVGKSGSEFRREMQRNSVSVRQLVHYKGHPDPLKGDALNKAVRETAQEALSALFASEESKPSATESLGGRIQGFGNTNFEPSDDRKSFISEVVNIGSNTIKQGLSNLTNSSSLNRNETGTYRGPNLRRSLTNESDFADRYEGVGSLGETQNSSRFQKNAGSVNRGQDLRTSHLEGPEGNGSTSYSEKAREARLLETIVTSGGVRLQPSREALHVFIMEASKLDVLALCHALESKLLSPLWQVRMKAVCVLEAMLRKNDDVHFSIVGQYFSENMDAVVKCSESPQASLRDKSHKVLSLLDGGQTGGPSRQERPANSDATNIQMPNLIDTGDADDLFGTEETVKSSNNQSMSHPSTSAAPFVDDFFSGSLNTDVNTIEQTNDDDPFADVSFHNNSNKEHEADIFSGMTLDKSGGVEPSSASKPDGSEIFDIFGSKSDVSQGVDNSKRDVNDMMASLSIMSENGSMASQNRNSEGALSPNLFPESPVNMGNQAPSNVLNSIFAPQSAGMNANPVLPYGAMPYTLPPGLVFNPSFAPQLMNYNGFGTLLGQQQLLATINNFQQLGNLHPDSAGSNGGYSSPLPDIFTPGVPNQTSTSMIHTAKKEETRAFDFISDHLAAARDPKRVL